ncbi:DUF305 domain-containing protein [Candidatus Microgenomates bacterium]|nr:DUF305 domain-containing protein [Candidatus Microgenomates bacterium]
MQKELLYGMIGLLVGVLVTTYVASNAFNTNNRGMMNMMGIRSNTSMGNNLDRHFIEQMIPHHQDAITMADSALVKAEHTEIKTLAANIKKTQSAEITLMRTWYKTWYGTDVPQDADDEAGSGSQMMGQMHGGMMGDNTDAKNLENAPNFDKAFIEEMIPHHQMAVMMANMLLGGTQRPEMKKLAQDIITAQTAEISQMRQWHTAWGY